MILRRWAGEDYFLTDFLIGTGGWAYFNVPNTHPLVAYSKAFNFVEVNSTFYEIPKMDRMQSWRKTVPTDSWLKPSFYPRVLTTTSY